MIATCIAQVTVLPLLYGNALHSKAVQAMMLQDC